MKQANRYQQQIGVLVLGLLGSTVVMAQTGIGQNGAGKSFNNVSIPDAATGCRASAGKLQVLVKTMCFGTNNRVVNNPVSAASKITMTLKVKGMAANEAPITVSFLGTQLYEIGRFSDAVFPGNPSLTADNVTGKVQAAGNSLVMERAIGKSYSELAKQDRTNYVESLTFSQTVSSQDLSNCKSVSPSGGIGVAACEYLAKDGDVTPVTTWKMDEECGNTLFITAAFPGQDGFCGGYHSPLMLFFDAGMPAFTGESAFPLNDSAETIHWMEPNAPGYLLALNEKGDGQITRADQLFGQTPKFKSGFEALAVHDTDKDGKITPKDKVWKKLVLWNDKNGNGKSEKGELFTLNQMKVKSIDLKYDESRRLNLGGRADAKESAVFSFTGKDGKVESGTVYDIWFNTKKARALPAADQK